MSSPPLMYSMPGRFMIRFSVMYLRPLSSTPNQFGKEMTATTEDLILLALMKIGRIRLIKIREPKEYMINVERR